jgi:hypothetical protein
VDPIDHPQESVSGGANRMDGIGKIALTSTIKENENWPFGF